MEMNVVGMAAEDREKWAVKWERARLGELDWTPEDDRLFPPAARASRRGVDPVLAALAVLSIEPVESVLEDPGTSWRWRAPSVLEVLETEVLREHINLFAARAAAGGALTHS